MRRLKLLDFNLDGSLDLFLFEGDGEDAVLEFGFDTVLVFADLDGEGDGAREFTPVALLDVPTGGLFVFAAAEDAGNS